MHILETQRGPLESSVKNYTLIFPLLRLLEKRNFEKKARTSLEIKGGGWKILEEGDKNLFKFGPKYLRVGWEGVLVYYSRHSAQKVSRYDCVIGESSSSHPVSSAVYIC